MTTNVHAFSPFVTTLFPNADGVLDLRAISRQQGVRPVQKFISPLDHAFIDRFINEHSRRDIYFGVGCRRDSTSGRLENCSFIRALFADLDFKRFPSPEEATARLNGFLLPPSIVNFSGGGQHLYWLLNALFDLQRDAARFKDLLRRLAWELDADLVAAEPAHILRLPGTRNFKYDPARMVTIAELHPERIYSLEDFDSVLPEEPKPPKPAAAAPNPSHGRPRHADRDNDFRRATAYLEKMDPAIEGNGGDRQTFIVCCAMLIDFGLDEDKAWPLLWQWNLRCQPPWPEDQLWQKMRNAKRYGKGVIGSKLNEPFTGKSSQHSNQTHPNGSSAGHSADDYTASEGPRGEGPSEGETGPQPVIIWLNTVTPKPVEWLWQGRIAAGKLSLLIGDPGLGKSTTTIDMAARITIGAAWPDGGEAPQGRILFLTAEDGLEDTVRPRVDLHGGDPQRVGVWTAVRTGADERPPDLSTDLAMLDAQLKILGDVRLIVIDPLSAYLGEKDSYKDAEVRRMLRPLAALAERHKVAVVGVMHMNKAEQLKALYRALASVAFVAAARTVFAVGTDKDDADRRIMVGLKVNIAAMPKALAFKIDQTGKLIWEDKPVEDVDADSVLSARPSKDRKKPVIDAETFLREMLANGEMPSEEIWNSAHENGIADMTLKRAKKSLGVKAELRGFGKAGKWFWFFPKASPGEAPNGDYSGEI